MKKLKLSRSHKLFLISAIVVFSVFGGTVISPFTTALAVTCSGYGCDNTSPVTTGCSSGAVTKKTANIYDAPNYTFLLAKVELRYSSTCKTIWSRITNLAAQESLDMWTSTQRRYSPNGTTTTVSDLDYNVSYQGSAYSPQLYLPASDSDGLSGRAGDYVSNGTVYAGGAYTAYWGGI